MQNTTKRILCTISTAILATTATFAGSNQHHKAKTSASDRKINNLIKQYLMNHPEDILKSVKMYQAKQQREQRQKMYDNALKNVNALRKTSFQTIAGNPNGNVTMVEFFDYQCVMCWRAYKGIEEVVSKNPNLRVIYRFLPIFGEASQYAAKVDLAAATQGKYEKFHDLMFKAKRIEGKLRDKDVRRVAKKAGVKLNKQTRKLINSTAGKKFIDETRSLASKLGVNGTPAFYIMPTKGKVSEKNFFVFNGAVPAPYLQQAIDIVSGKKPSKKAPAKTKKSK